MHCLIVVGGMFLADRGFDNTPEARRLPYDFAAANGAKHEILGRQAFG
jgi:hypothetical protein